MRKHTFLILLVLLTLSSCDKGSDKSIIEFEQGITAEWFKETGILDFSGQTPDHYMIYKFRDQIDTLNSSAFDYFEFKLPGKHYFQLFDGENNIGREVIFNRRIHLGIDHECTYNTPDSPYKRLNALNDGIVGFTEYVGPEWVGWKNKDAVIEYDFYGDRRINYVTINYRDDLENGIYPPQYILVEGSVDGENFVPKQRKNMDPPGFPVTTEQIPVRATYQKIRITVKNYSTTGDIDSWLLIDEAVVIGD